MARSIFFVFLLLTSSGCAVKMASGLTPQYDYTEYESYGQQHGTYYDSPAAEAP